MGKGMSKVLEGLYVGSLVDCRDQDNLEAVGITHVLSLLGTRVREESPQYLWINVKDEPTTLLAPHFGECIEFIHRARSQGGGVLVHCAAGVSRSVTITAAYILAISELTWKEAISAVRAVRTIANPNFGFQSQLQEWCESELWQWKEEIKRLPPVTYNDLERLSSLLAKHKVWVETGEEQSDEDFYPLAPGAYKAAEASRPQSRMEEIKAAMSERVRSHIRFSQLSGSNQPEISSLQGDSGTGGTPCDRTMQWASTHDSSTGDVKLAPKSTEMERDATHGYTYVQSVTELKTTSVSVSQNNNS